MLKLKIILRGQSMHRFWKFLLPVSGFICALPLAALGGVTSADPVNVGLDGQYLEASTDNNVVLHIPLAASAQGDTLQSLTIDNHLWDDPPAAEPVDLAAASIKLWYQPVDTGFNPALAQLCGTFTFNNTRGYPSWDLTGLAKWVGNGGALYVTVKISNTPTAGNACRFSVGSSNLLTAGGAFPLMDLPVQPPRMLITTAYPADHLAVSHTNTGQILLSTGQTFSPMQFLISNPDPSWPLIPLAPIFLSGLTVTVRDAANNVTVPARALDQIGLRDLDTGVFTLVSALPATAAPCYIPMSVSIQAADTRRFELFGIACSNTTTVLSSFRLEWGAGTSLASGDAYTGVTVPVLASGDAFPMQSNLFSVNFAATQAQAFHTAVMPNNSVVLKGQANVNPLNFTFINPGNSNTARIDITRITLSVTDAAGNTITPASVFSRVALGGGILYGQTTSIPTSGSLITITLTNSFCSVPVYQPVTVSVLADILPTASAVAFRLSLPNALAVRAQDSNSALTLPLSAAFASDPFPMVSNAIRIASSFQVQGQSLASQTLYPGERVGLLSLTFTHPGPTDIGPLWLQGMTLTARDRNGSPLNLAANVASVSLVDSRVVTVSQAVPTAGASIYLPLSAFNLGPFGVYPLQVFVQMLDHPRDTGLTIGLADNSAVGVVQVNDPTRPVYVSGAWPIMSTLASVGGGEGQLMLSNYPNPFAPAHAATSIAYYLNDNATVTAALYTLSGDKVRSLCVGALQTIGEHILTWDGRTESGQVVLNGVYLLRVEAATLTTKQKIVQLRKIAVVK
jgi:hypothetical protein